MEGRFIILFAPVWTLFCLIMAGFGGIGLGLQMYLVGAVAMIAAVLISFAAFELRRLRFRRHPLARRRTA